MDYPAMDYPLKIKVLNERYELLERLAYGREVRDGRTTKVLVYEPKPNSQMGRFLMVNWCETHQVGWEGSGDVCPLCQVAMDANKRMRSILTSTEGA